jgi:hypothetical protein
MIHIKQDVEQYAETDRFLNQRERQIFKSNSNTEMFWTVWSRRLSSPVLHTGNEFPIKTFKAFI